MFHQITDEEPLQHPCDGNLDADIEENNQIDPRSEESDDGNEKEGWFG